MPDKSAIYKSIQTLIDGKKDKFLKVSDQLWDYAETRFVEYKSAEFLAKVLEEEGFEVVHGVGDVETAVIGTWGAGSPVIGFMGEYDALANLSQAAGEIVKKPIEEGKPGQGCGHHLLGAGALMAAVALRDYMKENGLKGTVKFFGCPAEEGGSGKTYMLRTDVFKGTDICLTWHPGADNNVLTTSSLANIQCYFHFKGRSAHAAGSPENGRSALDAVELMNVASNYLREHVPTTSRLHYAIVNAGGSAPNVVQAEASVLYLMRAPRMDGAKNIYERICKIAQGAALMTETEVTIDFDKACSNYLANITLSDVLYEVMTDLGAPEFDKDDMDFAQKLRATLSEGERNKTVGKTYNKLDWQELEEKHDKEPLATFIHTYHPELKDIASPGSTDVGDVSWVIPTAQFYCATAPKNTSAHTWQWVSSGKSGIAHKGTVRAAEIMAATALIAYNDPKIIENAKAELNKVLEKMPYENPIPAHVKPRIV
ncbi:MAG: M20 family metallopeptidase [Defluviitaleaceae bacterium]|nr:M20 family metallopeptidase [Defluviitaleaceae bacterium]